MLTVYLRAATDGASGLDLAHAIAPVRDDERGVTLVVEEAPGGVLVRELLVLVLGRGRPSRPRRSTMPGEARLRGAEAWRDTPVTSRLRR